MKRKALIQQIAYRRSHITTADDTFTECERLTSTPVDKNEQSKRHWRRAAKLYEQSAELYRRGGLGLRAIASWKAAAKCFEALEMNGDYERCRLKALAIPVYYEEDRA